MAGTLLFILGVLSALTLWLVLSPPRRPGEIAASLFAWSWLAGELPVHLAAALIASAGTLVVIGALDTTLGLVGLALAALGLVSAFLSWREAGRVRARVLAGGPLAVPVPWWRYALPWWAEDRAVVRVHERRDGVELDRYLPRAMPPGRRPTLVYVHGGGWVLGFRRWQGRLFIRRLVRAGWIAVSVEYRRWPRATWPMPLDDVRLALARVRAEAAAWGVDPARIVLSGNSAGAHLAALVALTDRDPTPVRACVAWYGVYDLVDEGQHWPHGALERLWAWLLLREAKARALERWRDASPLTHVHAAAPRFIMVHGTRDSLVPIEAARAFAARLAEVSGQAPALFEIEGAQHAFDVFTSRRGAYAVELVARAMDSLLGSARADDAPAPPSGVATP